MLNEELDNYFYNVVTKLKHEDISVLGILVERNATSHFKSVGKQLVMEESGLTEAMFRKAVYHLTALDFIQVVSSSKENLLFLSGYGNAAFQLFWAKECESEVI